MLGIDDPVAWMNAVGGKVLDQWIAYLTTKVDYDKPDTGMLTPEEQRKRLQGF